MASTSKQPWETKQISVKDLVLWDENSRIPDYLLDGEERDLILILLKQYELEKFAEEIIKDFDLPQLERIVVWRKKKQLVVLEGNRRLATYKCLIDPSIIDDDRLKSKFTQLKAKVDIDGNYKLESLVTDDRDQGMRFIERKHYYGNNERRWEQYERDHHIRRTRDASGDTLSQKERDSIFRANLADKVKLVNLPDAMKRKVLGRGVATTFYRVVGGTEARKKLRYERLSYDLKIENEQEFLNLLKVIIFNILEKKTLDGSLTLNSRTLNDETAIRKYLNSIGPDQYTEVDSRIASSRTNRPSETSKTKAGKSKKKTKKPAIESFTSLVDPNLVLGRNCPNKTRVVFLELQRIDVSQCPTAASILVRILIEVTIDEFLKKKGEHSQRNLELVKKINYVKDKYINDPDLKKTVDVLNNDLLTKKLNQVAHNTVFLATETSIKDIWKNLFSFFKFLTPGIKNRS